MHVPMLGLRQVLPRYGHARTVKWARGKAAHVRGGFQLGRRMRVRAKVVDGRVRARQGWGECVCALAWSG